MSSSSETFRRWSGIALLLALLVLSFLAPKRWDSATLQRKEQGLSLELSAEPEPEPIPLAGTGPERPSADRQESPPPEKPVREQTPLRQRRPEAATASRPRSAEPALVPAAGPQLAAASSSPAPEADQQPVKAPVLLPATPLPVVQAPVRRPLVAPEPSRPEPRFAAAGSRPEESPVRPGGTLSLNRPVGSKVPSPIPPQPVVPPPAEAGRDDWAFVPPGLKHYLESAMRHAVDAELLEQAARCSGELYQRVCRGEEIEELCQQQRHLEQRLLAQADSRPPQAAVALRRLAHAMARRRVLWQSVDRLHRWQKRQRQAARQRNEELLASALELEQALNRAGAEAAWQRFLLLPELKQQAQALSAEQQRWNRLVGQFLNRVGMLRRDPQYERLPQWEQLRRLQQQLCSCALERFQMIQLPEVAERFERSGDEVSRSVLVQYLQLVEHGSPPEVESLPRELINHWNNTNVRLAVHNRLLAQLVPQAPPRWQRVYETILGIPVRGRSWTTTRVDVRTLPGPGARLVITARGLVRSWTQASQGLVTTHERTVARFTARRLVQLSSQGLRSWPTRLELQARSQLDDLETELDGIPLLGDLIREIALSQREELLPEAQAEARWKLRRRIQAQFDRQVDQALAALDRKRVNRLNQLRKRLKLAPLLLAQTTDQRLVLRLRLAGPDQLGAHTPRPRALAGSWASLQVHESALNNVLDRLQLAGRRFTLPELEQHLQQLLEVPVRLGEKKDRKAVFRFAQRHPVRVQLSQGQIRLRIGLAELATAKRRWRNLTVEVRYRPVRQGRWYYLQRDGYVQLAGRMRSLGAELVVRGIFNRIFHRQRRWPLYPPAWEQDARMGQLAMTQCVVDDGWLGISLGPLAQLSVAAEPASEARPR